MVFDLEKFGRLVQYVCHQAPQEKFGAVKLNKVLWISEKYWYDKYGETVTGEVFIRKPQGPVASHMLQVRDTLERGGRVKIGKSKPQKGEELESTVFHSKHKPDMNDFPAEFVAAVDVFLQAICNEHTSQTISVKTHDWLWRETADGQPMSFAAYYRNEDITAAEQAWADSCSL